MGLVFILILLLSVTVLIAVRHIRRMRIDRWLIPYLSRPRGPRFRPGGPIHLYIAFCNRISPFWGGVSQEIAEHRIVTWCREYTRFSSEHADSQGRRPVHTFFYEESDYNPHFIDSLHKLCREGIADVEILLHHEADTPEGFRRKIEGFRDVLFHHHGLLRKDSDDRIAYGFIHGAGALNNCRPDRRYCGVNQESLILKQTGCYADFTFPSAPDITQPPILNRIYFSAGSSDCAASHEKGYAAGTQKWSHEDLLFIQGPLGLNWHNRRYGLIPRVENGEISNRRRFSRKRMQLWVESAIHPEGAPEHIFIKLHTFGAVDSTVRYLFGESGIHDLYRSLETDYRHSGKYILHYVSAYEMYCTIRSACQSSPAFQNQRHTIAES